MSLTRQEMEERAYLLLYGLLEEEEAEELRSLVATDSEVAIAFETARSTVDFLADFVRIVPSSDSSADAFIRNVAVDISVSTPFAFDPVLDSSDDGVFTEEQPSDIYSAEPAVKDNNTEVKFTRRGKIKRKFKISEDSSSNPLFRQGSVLTKNAWRDAFLHGFGTLFRGIGGGIDRFFAVMWRSPVFVGLFSTIFLLGGVVTVAALRCDHLLTRHFFDDFRVQIAIPRTLVRGVTQSIIVRTTGVDGRPRRIPIRLCFADLTSRKILLNHTESGNSDGNLSYEIPNLADYPDVIRLSILVGADESEIFTTSLKVINLDRQFAKFQAPEERTDESRLDEGQVFVSPIRRDFLESFFDSNSRQEVTAPGGDCVDSVEDGTTSLKEDSERICLRFYPESGRFISGFVNNVSVFCSDKDGRPLARRFSIFYPNSDKPIVTFDTSNHGFACFQWIPPDERTLVAVALCSDSGKDNDEHIQNPFLMDWRTNNSAIMEQSSYRFPNAIEINPLNGECFAFFCPEVTSEPAYFSLDSHTTTLDEPVSGRLSVTTKAPLVVTVEKYGVTVWQQFLTTSKGSEVFNLALPKSLSGFLTVSLYGVFQRRFLKLAESSVFRSSNVPASLEYLTKLEESKSTSEGRLLVIDKVDLPTDDTTKPETSRDPERNVRATVYWAAKTRDALETLDLDEVLMGLDEITRDEVVRTASSSSPFNPPIIFDNLDNLAQSAHVKLESFKEDEAQSFLWIVRLVFVVCISVVFASLFFAVFRVFSLGKSFLLCILSVGLFFFTFELQNMLDAFIQSSQDVVFAIDEGDNQRTNQQIASSLDRSLDKVIESSVFKKGQEKEQSVRLITTSELKNGVLKLRLDELLLPTERSCGVVFVKLDDGDRVSINVFSLGAEEL